MKWLRIVPGSISVMVTRATDIFKNNLMLVSKGKRLKMARNRSLESSVSGHLCTILFHLSRLSDLRK